MVRFTRRTQGTFLTTVEAAETIQAASEAQFPHLHYHGATKELRTVLNAIYDFRKAQEDTLAKATPGTVEWLFLRKHFSIWWNGNGNIKILWASGILGAGKTILASLVIDELEHRAADPADQICVAYFYMRSSEHKVTVVDVLEVLVKQSLERHEHLLPLVEKAYARDIRKRCLPSETQLLTLLQKLIAHMKFTFYVLVALEKAPVDIQHDLVEKLASLNAQIFVTSGPMPDVQASFPEAHCFEVASRDRDLDLHIAKKLQGSPRLRALLDQGNPSFRQQVASSLKTKCGGMFLHATLQLDALTRCLTVPSVMRILERFPTKLEDVYAQTWERILQQDPEHVALAELALAWVLYAERSLTIDELLFAVAICPETHRFKEERLVPESTIVGLCYGLITVGGRSRLVRLVHHTAKQPMEALLRTLLPQPHSPIAAFCVARLMDCGFQNTPHASTRQLRLAFRTNTLLKYAFDHWAFHAQETLALDSAASSVPAFIAGCRAFPGRVHDGVRHCVDVLGTLHLVALYGFPITFAGLRWAHNANAQTTMNSRTALHLACLHGHHSTVQSLLGLLDIRVNAKDRRGQTPLMLACRKGYAGIVKLLYTHPDFDINVVDNWTMTALMWAIWSGEEDTVELLLAHPKIRVNLVDEYGNTALIEACQYGRESIFELLLAHRRIKVNRASHWRSTALLQAAQFHVGIVKLLLAVPDIDVNATDGCRDTAIKLAAGKGFEEVVRMLLQVPGIKTSVKSIHGGTAIESLRSHTSCEIWLRASHSVRFALHMSSSFHFV